MVVDTIEFAQPKTKQMIALLSQLDMGNSVLIVLAEVDVNVQKSARNLPGVKVLLSQGLNVYDLLRYRKILFTRTALQQVSERLG